MILSRPGSDPRGSITKPETLSGFLEAALQSIDHQIAEGHLTLSGKPLDPSEELTGHIYVCPPA